LGLQSLHFAIVLSAKNLGQNVVEHDGIEPPERLKSLYRRGLRTLGHEHSAGIGTPRGGPPARHRQQARAAGKVIPRTDTALR
jgi:hypothetical protein